MEDIAPALLKRIQNDFQSEFDKSKVIAELYEKVRDGTATYVEANDFAIEVGEILSRAYKKNLSSAVLPDGKMYYNIAQRIFNPTMKNNYELITDVTAQVQQALNEAAHVGIKPITSELNQDRIDGIINRVSSEKVFDDVSWILGESVVNFSQSIVDDAIRVNADFQSKAGLSPKIVRTSTGKCCNWCNRIVGIYDYYEVGNQGNDVFRRHNYCRCKVDYMLGKYRENVHNNNTGKRRYVSDGYGGYKLSREARIEKAKKMMGTEKERKEAARKKRIETWENKKKNVVKSVESSTIKTEEGLSKYVGKNVVGKDNQSVREWYYANVHDIPNQIDASKPFEEQVKQAYNLRNKYKQEAREAMLDRETAERLEKKRPVKSFDELLQDKMKRKNMTREEALKDILETASKTNADVDKEFGL